MFRAGVLIWLSRGYMCEHTCARSPDQLSKQLAQAASRIANTDISPVSAIDSMCTVANAWGQPLLMTRLTSAVDASKRRSGSPHPICLCDMPMISISNDTILWLLRYIWLTILRKHRWVDHACARQCLNRTCLQMGAPTQVGQKQCIPYTKTLVPRDILQAMPPL